MAELPLNDFIARLPNRSSPRRGKKRVKKGVSVLFSGWLQPKSTLIPFLPLRLDPPYYTFLGVFPIATIHWRSPVLVVMLSFAAFAASITTPRAEPTQKGDEKPPPAKGTPVNTELLEVLKKHFPLAKAQWLAEQDLPAVLAKPVKDSPADDELRKLANGRYNGIVAMTTFFYVVSLPNLDYNDKVLANSRLLLGVGLEVHERPKERILFLNQMVEFCRTMAKKTDNWRDDSPKDYAQLEWAVFAMEVETELLKAKKAAKAEK